MNTLSSEMRGRRWKVLRLPIEQILPANPSRAKEVDKAQAA